MLRAGVVNKLIWPCLRPGHVKLALPKIPCVAVNTIGHIACVVCKFVELAVPKIACVAVKPSGSAPAA